MTYRIKEHVGVRSETHAVASTVEIALDMIRKDFGGIIIVEEDKDYPDHYDLFTKNGCVLSIEPIEARP